MQGYKFFIGGPPASQATSILNSAGACIPLDPDNTDYQQFLVDWEAGATVLSSTGVPLPWGSEPS